MEERDLRFSRTARLLGPAALDRLTGQHILILGLGGVGGYVAETLARLGVGALTLVDGDRVDVSNCNRQLAALESTVGSFKAEVVAARCREINPAGNFSAVPEFLHPEEITAFLDAHGFDGAVDAIDDVPAKCAFLAECCRRALPLASAMGAGGKLDPALVRIADISKTFGCPLARTVRVRLRGMGITRGIRTVFSPEPPVRAAGPGPIGSLSYVVGVFGCFCTRALLEELGYFSGSQVERVAAER